MRVKQISKKLISVLLSLSVIASMLVMSSISVSAESTEEFSPSWNYTRNCSIKKSDGSSENIQVAGLPQTGIFFHINDLNNDLEKHPIRVKFSISSNKPLIFGYMTGTFEDIDTDTSDDWSAYSFKNNNRSISLIGADGNGAYEWNSNYYEYSGGVISIPFFKGDISKSDIVRAVSYGLEDNLNEYLSNDYSVKYEITVQDMYGRTISHFDKYDEVNTPEDLSITLTSDEENGKSTISGALATVNYSGATAFDSSTGIYAELSENKKIYPIYADDETKLPNYGIIADLSSVDFSEYPDSKLVVKFNPNGDKKLNSQADNYNDSAVKLSASTGVWNDNTFKANKKDKTVVEAYPDSNSYQYTSVVPIDANNNVIVFRVFPGGSYDTDEKYLSALFNFTYEISLEDKYGRTIKSYSKDDGEVKNASSNYIACGTLSDVDNPIDKWVIKRGGTLSNCSIQFNIPIENDVPTYKLSYDSNGATSGKSPIDNTPYFENEIANIINDSGTAEKSGYKFIGWAVKSDSKDNISTIKMDSDKKVYAIWKELEHLKLPVTGSNSELMLIVAGILLTGTGAILLIRKRKHKLKQTI